MPNEEALPAADSNVNSSPNQTPSTLNLREICREIVAQERAASTTPNTPDSQAIPKPTRYASDRTWVPAAESPSTKSTLKKSALSFLDLPSYFSSLRRNKNKSKAKLNSNDNPQNQENVNPLFNAALAIGNYQPTDEEIMNLFNESYERAAKQIEKKKLANHALLLLVKLQWLKANIDEIRGKRWGVEK